MNRFPISGRQAQTAAWAVLLGGITVFLIFIFPYSSGYGRTEQKKTLFIRAYEYYGDPNWTHCMFAPLVAAFLVYFLRKEWRGLPLRGSWIGLPVLILGLLLFWFGYRANIRYVGFGAIQMLLTGGVLWFMGWKWFRALLLPLIFLCFAWPLVPLAEGRASFELRQIMTTASSGFLNLIGLDNLREGSRIMSMPDPAAGLELGERFQMGIDDPCSGLRSLFALLMVGTIMAFIMLKSGFRRFVLIAMIIPIAMTANLGRLLMLVFGTIWFGSEFAIGKDGGTSDFHLLAGVFVFLLGAGLLFLIALLLKGGVGSFRRKSRVSRITSTPASSA